MVRQRIARFVSSQLTKLVTIDLSRKQIAGDTVTWTVRFNRGRGPRVDGPAQAVFAGNAVVTLHLGVTSAR